MTRDQKSLSQAEKELKNHLESLENRMASLGLEISKQYRDLPARLVSEIHNSRGPEEIRKKDVMIEALVNDNIYLQERVTELKRKLETVQNEATDIQKELRRAQKNLQSTAVQLDEAQEEVKSAENEAAKLRSIILNGANTQEVTDDKVTQSFVMLEQAIQKIVRSNLLSVEICPAPTSIASERMNLKAFYDPQRWGTLSAQDRKLRLRAQIFFYLHVLILDRRCFGIAGFESKSARGDDAGTGLIEHGLRRLEKLLGELNVDQNIVQDWRITTIKCITKCNIEATTSQIAADEIHSLLLPLMNEQDPSSAQVREFCSIIRDLAQDAFQLRMMMRQSKEGYSGWPPAENFGDIIDLGKVSLEKYERYMEPVAVASGKESDRSDEVAYIMFGGLVKTIPGQQDIVLEKSQVVLKRKEHTAK
ncbi:hypothetical protein B0T14DRAFT_497138 [Immersiella caudata]|uniref:Uncharacterized protein n=1 Tax=Immersiella caudata TaxID=314043 RepID=A0AA40C0Q0_9PEZI|nr:hypothetical protein B0T14DRAFT_497138 [Immersiella caudata]